MAKGEINIEVNARVSDDAKFILNRQERMEQKRLDFIADLYRYTANLILTFDKDESETAVEQEGEA